MTVVLADVSTLTLLPALLIASSHIVLPVDGLSDGDHSIMVGAFPDRQLVRANTFLRLYLIAFA